MKNKFKLSVVAGLAAVLLIPSFAFSQDKDLKKSRHIKMVKIENGKKMEIDTVLTGDNVFIWHGDTINPGKQMKSFTFTESDKLPGKGGMPMRGRMYRHQGDFMRNQMTMHSDSDKEIQIFVDGNDTTKQKIFIHKMMKDGDGKDRMIFFGAPGHRPFPGVPPVPPMQHMRRMALKHAGNNINLNDPNVISFKKKDIGGGKEKIEIIRKKTKETDHQEFNYNFNENFQVPEPPMPPSFNEDKDHGNMIQEKIEIEKGAADKKAERKAAKENK